MNAIPHAFSHCPGCGSKELAFNGINRFTCPGCGFVFYQNTAAAVGAILTVSDRDDAILFLRRAVDPARGALDFPGGFIDPGESVEEALRREIREEIDSEVYDLNYLTSAPNRYAYRDVVYPTCDLVFTGRIAQSPHNFERSEISQILILRREEIDPDTIAFPSLRSAMQLFLRTR